MNSHSHPHQQRPILQNMHLAYDNHQSYKPADEHSLSIASQFQPQPQPQGHVSNLSGEPMKKKKRGRPRKYAPDGGGVAAGAFSPPQPQQQQQQMSEAPATSGLSSPSPSSLGIVKKANKKHQQRTGEDDAASALGCCMGIGFTPHVIAIQAGEDVAARIMSLYQDGPRAVCILSANGAISHVTLYQAPTSSGTVTYQGRFEILSLSGSFMLSERQGQRSMTWGLSVSFAGPDGRVLGGGVAGLLTAATPVQVVVASFMAEGPKVRKSLHRQLDPISATPGEVGGAPFAEMGPSTPTSQGGIGSESSTRPLNLGNSGIPTNPSHHGSFLGVISWK